MIVQLCIFRRVQNYGIETPITRFLLPINTLALRVLFPACLEFTASANLDPAAKFLPQGPDYRCVRRLRAL